MNAKSRLVLLIVLIAGCGSEPPHRSPTPAEDPARYERALAETAKVERENREAEAAFYKRMGSAQPPADNEPELKTVTTTPEDSR